MKTLVVFVALCALSACGGGSGSGSPAPRGVLTSISVSPSSPAVAAGLTQQFSATGTYDDGTSRPLTNVSWSSSDGSIVTINNSGLASSHKQGNAVITATASSVSGTAALTVIPPVAQAYSLYPPAANVPIGTTQKFSVLAQNSDGTTSDVSSNYTWQLTDPTVGTVDAIGNVTSSNAGYARLNATLLGGAQVTAQNASLPTSATADVAGVYYPRFAFVNFLASRYLEKLSIDGASGQLRYYQRFLTNNYNTVFGCMTADPTNQFLYLTEPTANLANGPDKYSLFQTDALTGELNEVPGSPFPVSGSFGCLRFDPAGKFAFATVVVWPGASTFTTFTRDVNTGILTQLSSVPLSDPATEIALAPSGQFLYFNTYHATTTPPSAQAFGYSIDPVSGAVTPIPGTPFAISAASGTFSMHPSGTLLFMSNTNGTSIDVYSIDGGTGALTALSSKSISTCVNPSPLTFSAHGQIAYFICRSVSSSGSLNTLHVADDGTMSLVASTPLSGLSNSFALDPTGKYLYVLGIQPSIETFQIDVSGIPQPVSTINGLTMAGNVFILAGNSPTSYATTAAYITSAGDSHLTTYAVQTDGTFNTTPVSVLGTQPGPHSLSTTPGATQMMATSSAPHPNVGFYDLDPVTGAPSGPALYGVPDLSGTVLFDITRQFAFETDPVGGAVYTFAKYFGWSDVTYLINGQQVSGIAAGAGAGPMTNDPSGQLLYVGNTTAHSISAYRYYDPEPEEQTAQFTSPYTDGSPYPTNAAPISLGVDMSAKTLCAVFDDGTLRSYQIDMFSGGHIAQAASVNLNGMPQALAVQPSSERVYVATSTGITGFSIDPNTGNLSPISSATIAMANINGIYVEPSGNFLYVTTSPQGSPGGVYGYSIAADGSLAALGTAPLVPSLQPTSMTFKSIVQ